MSVYPEVRVYADPFEGLTVQLTELRGLIKIVPPLIEADRERRWTEIGERPSDGEDGDIIDVYGAEAGPEEVLAVAVDLADRDLRELVLGEERQEVFGEIVAVAAGGVRREFGPLGGEPLGGELVKQRVLLRGCWLCSWWLPDAEVDVAQHDLKLAFGSP